MRLDPGTHAFVQATAFITSLSFAIFALNLIAALLNAR
jgi:hypothetical protein